MAKVGIDFGTTNSSIYFYNSATKEYESLLRNKNDISVTYAPSELYIKKSKEIICGWNIAEPYRESKKSIIFNLKEILLNDSNNEKIYGIDKWDLFKAYMLYLINNANKSPILAIKKDKITDVVISTPVGTTTLYKTKIKEIIESTEFESFNNEKYKIVVSKIQEEPVSISLTSFENNKNKNILVYDMGGGTTDFAVVNFENNVSAVIDHDYINKAGNYIDRLIVKSILKKINFSEKLYYSNENKAFNSELYGVRKAKEEIEEYGDMPIKLSYNNKIIYDEDYSEEQYYNAIRPFINETIEKIKPLVNKYHISTIILAGGSSNCLLIQKMLGQEFKKIFIANDMVDKRIATAIGNVQWYNMPKINNILSFSYGTHCFNEELGKDYILNFFKKNEELPIIDRKITLHTLGKSVEYMYLDFYLGHTTFKYHDYNLTDYKLLADKSFTFQFGQKVPKYTSVTFFISMDINGVMTIRCESLLSTKGIQYHKITDLK